MTIPIFVGFDARESIAYHVFCQSVLAHTKANVAFYPISGAQRDGSNSFIYERFKAAQRMGFHGRAIYADSDMLFRTDVAELYEIASDHFDVMVCPHDYRTKFPVKYWGRPNHDYPRKNWSSLMLINCNAASWQRIDVDKMSGQELHRFEFVDEKRVGILPLEWNWLAGEYDYNPNAKNVHFTLGIPPLWDYSVESIGYVAEWWRTYSAVTRASEKA